MADATAAPFVLHFEISPHLAALCKDVVDNAMRHPAEGGLLLKDVLLEGIAAYLKREAPVNEREAHASPEASANEREAPTSSAGLPAADCIDVLLVQLQNMDQELWPKVIHDALTSGVLAYVNQYTSVESMLRRHDVEASFRETLLSYLENRGFTWYKRTREPRTSARALVWQDSPIGSEVWITDEFVVRICLDMAPVVDGPGWWRADTAEVVTAQVHAYQGGRGDYGRNRYAFVGTREACKEEVALGLRAAGLMFAAEFSLPSDWTAHTYIVETRVLTRATRTDGRFVEEVGGAWRFGVTNPYGVTPVHVATFPAPTIGAAIAYVEARWRG